MPFTMETSTCRVRGGIGLPTVIYLPGAHGDATLAGAFGTALGDRVRWVEIDYPRSTSIGLPEIARSVLAALDARGVRDGWLVAESFGSQVAWEIIARVGRGESGFRLDGLFLAGGFVRYPWRWLVGSARAASANLPSRGVALLLGGFIRWARWIYGTTPEKRASVEAFAARRREPGDFAALTHRLRLIRDNDPRPIARAWRGPVWSLAGRWDAMVPIPLVHRWLRRECPGWRGAEVFWRSDHLVLVCQPEKAADAVRRAVRGEW